MAARAPRGSGDRIDRRVLAALIRVMNHRVRPALRDAIVERLDDETRAQMRRHRPPMLRRLQTSRTTARYSVSAPVGIYVMSATHS